MPRRQRAETALFLLLVLGFTANNVAFVRSYSDALSCYNLGIDTEQYRDIGRQLADGAPLSSIPTGVPPGFVVLLSLLFQLFGNSLLAPKLVFTLMTTCMSVITWLIGRRFSGRLAGFAAGLAVVSSPMLGAYSATLQYEVPTAFWFTTSIALLLALESPREVPGNARFSRGALPPVSCPPVPRRHSLWLIALSGIALAAAALTREVMVVCFPVMLTWLLLRSQSLPLGRIRQALTFALVFLVLVGAWIVHGSIRSGALVPISTKGAPNFAIGNNPNANGTFNLNVVEIVDPKGWDFIKERPVHWVTLLGRKFMLFWGFSEDGWNVPRRAAVHFFRLGFGLVPFALCLRLAQGVALALLCFVGTCLILKVRSALWVLPASIAAVMLVHLLFISSHRFAVPVLPAIYLVAAVSLCPLVERLRLVSSRLGIGLLGVIVAWLTAAFFYDPPAMLEWRPAAYRAAGTELVVDPKAPSQSALLVSRSAAPTRVVWIPDTLLLKGFAQLAVDFESEAGQGTEALEARVYTEKRGVIQTVRTAKLYSQAQTKGGVTDLTGVRKQRPAGKRRPSASDGFSFYLPEDQVVKTEILGLGPELRLNRMVMRFGLSEMPEEAARLSCGETQTLDMGSEPSSVISLGEGWSHPETWPDIQTVQWATGGTAFVYVSCSAACDLDFSFRTAPFRRPQRVSLAVNDAAAGQVELQSGWSDYSVRVPNRLLRNGLNLLALQHTDSTRPSDLGVSADRRPLNAAYDWLTVSLR